MSRQSYVCGVVAVLAVFICLPAFATPYTSNQSGDWSVAATWAPAGVPGAGDDVTITNSHVITVSDARSIDSVTFLNNSGGKELHLVTGGALTVLDSGTAVQLNPSSDGTNLLLMNGGTLTLGAGSLSINGGGLSLARARFTSLGGTLSIAGDLLFTGNSVNAQLQFDAASNGTVQIGGDLGNGGNLVTSGSASTFEFNGPAGQTINPYTFQNLTINKSGLPATLNGSVTVNGNLSIPSGVLDDGGFQISLDGTGGSLVSIGANGVLKLGSEFVATTFPLPVNPANVTLTSGSAVVYQSATGQTIEDSIPYQRLFLNKIGTAAGAFKNISNSLLKVLQELYVDGGVTVDFDNDVLDVDGDINGNGTIQLSNTVVPGNMTVAGNWSGGSLTAANGTTVTYDGSGTQAMLGATYKNLVINKPSGDLTLSGAATVMNSLSLTSGNVVITSGSFMIDVLATVSRISGHFVGPLTMGMNATPSRMFHVGTAGSYLPVDADSSMPGTLTIQAADAPHPNATGINTLDRYWTVTTGSITSLDNLQFNYNPSDVTNGDETKYRLARYAIGTWTNVADVNDAADTVSTGFISPFTGDWVIGQKGSVGFASQVAITSVNGGSDPIVNTPFDVDVETRHDDGSAANVTLNTTIDVLLASTGAGSLLGASVNLTSGTSSGTATGLTYDTVESNVQLNASSGAGDSLDPGNSAFFDVVAIPSTLTVTTNADSGPGSLRQAITDLNGGGCTTPCTIAFDSSADGNILLASQLPAITVGPVTIDGDTSGVVGFTRSISADGAAPIASITVSLDGSNSVQYGLLIQTPGVTVTNLGFRNFSSGLSGAAIKIDNVSGCTISGNYIGTDNAGAVDEGNYAGVIVFGAGATGNVIGGNSGPEGNLISGSTTNGVTVVNANNNQISNNYIGTDDNGSVAIANLGHGISLTGTTAGTTVNDNRIGFNGLKGIDASTSGIGNAFRRNEIFSNTGMAIDLGNDGPTVNTAGDADTGTNNLQNYPDISSANVSGGNVAVTVSLDSSLGVNASFFVLDFYKADTSAPSQAIEYLGSSGCLANPLANHVLSVPSGSLTAAGKIVATATAYSGAACTGVSEGTSELSPGFTVNGDVHWINGAGGAWTTGANWNTGSVPTSADNAIIDAPGTYTVTLTSAQTVQSLTIGTGVSGAQTLQLSGAALTLNAASTIANTGVLDLNNNILGTGTLTNNGQILWNTGTFNNGGLTNAASMTLQTAGAKGLIATTLTNNAGATILWSGGTINMQTGGAIVSAGTFETNFDGTFNNAGTGGAFTNGGTFRKSGGTGSTTFSAVYFNHNSGQVEVQQGALDLAGGSAFAPINISSGKKLIVNSDTYIFDAGVSLTGAGKVEVSTGGTLTVSSSLNFPALHVTGGLVGGAGNVIAGAGQLIVWDGGTFGTGGGKLQITGTGSLQIATPSAKTTTRAVEIIGGTATAFWSGGTINLGTGGSINNAGTFDSSADTTLNNSGAGTATFTNTGTFKKSGGAASTVFSNVDLLSSNLLRVASGTVNLANATLSGNVDLDPGTILLVDGDQVTLNAPTFPDTGLLYVTGGTLTMDGIFSLPQLQADNGTLNGTGTVTHSGPFVWNGGTLTGGGSTSIGAGGSLSIAGASAKALDRVLSILAGQTATWSGGTINVGTSGAINNAGTFDATADNVMNKSAGGTPALTNTGTLRKSGGAGMTSFQNVAINSTNTIHIQTGSLDAANASISGTVDLDLGTKLRIDSDTVTIAGATSFTDVGSVDIQGGTLMVTSNVTIPALLFNSGTIDGTATLTLGNTATWGGGTMQGSGVTAVASAATLTLNGAAKILNARTLRPLAGSTVNWTLGQLSMSGGGNIDNFGLFAVTFDGNINNSGSAGPFANNNGGTLRKSTTTGSLTLTGVSLSNAGIVDIDLGKIDVSGTYTQTAAGSLDILLGGVVPGTQHGQLVTNSSPTLAGALNITFNGPYQPLVNDDFAVVAWPSDSHAGNFTYNLPALANGRTWSSFFNASGLHLKVNGGNADLSLSKTASSASVLIGHAISYTLAVNNAGPDDASNVQVTDTLPPGHTGISASGTGWTCSVVADTVTCSIASLPVGAAPVITINATAPSTPQSLNNTATVATTSTDPVAGNNSGSAVVSVNALSADVEVLAFGPAAPVAQNSGFQFTFQVKNNGPQSASGVSFNAPIPSTLTYNAATPGSGTCSFAAGAVSCSLGTIVSAGSVNVVINLTSTSTVGTHTVTGSASASEGDAVAGNNSAVEDVEVSGASMEVTNNSDAGPGSLRQALLDAQSGLCTLPCTITFNIPPAALTITPVSDLPPLVSSVTLDGTTQPGFAGTPIVRIDGGLLNTSPGTLVINGNNATIRGLSLTGANGTSPGIRVNGNGNTVAGNFIGVDPTEAVAANGTGISINGNANTIGGAGDGNIIGHNNGDGVDVVAGTGNSILENNIHENVLLGIDLAANGATPNDTGDGDSGANNLQNSPTVTSAVLDGVGGMTIASNINSSASSAGSILLEYFEADSAGEGESFIVRACVAGNSFGLGTSFAAPASIAAGDSIVATATAYSDGACNTVADGTSEFSNVVVVTTCTAPSATLTTPPSVCTTATGSASVNAPAAVSYAWTATNATIVSGQGTSAIQFTAAASGSVNLSVTVEDGNGCTNTVSNTFPITPTPIVNIAGPTATCAGTPVTLDAGNFASYSWSTSETTQTIIVSPSSAQTYTVTVTDANGCTAVDTHTVNVSANPTATITTPPSVCAGANGNASVASQPGALYAWTITNGTIVGAANGSSITFTAGPSGNVGLSVTVSVGSCTANGSANVPIGAIAAVNITGPTSVCANTPFTLNAGGSFASYLWSNGATSPSITVSQTNASQVYSVTVTTAAGCSTSDTHTVTASGPSAAITAPASAAAHATGLTASVPLQAGAAYVWTIENGAITAGQGTHSITFDAGDSGAGSTTLTVQVTLSGCTSTGSHGVNLPGAGPAQADVSITKTAPASVQPGATIAYAIAVHNAGPTSLSYVTIADPLPAGTSLSSFSGGSFTCAFVGSAIVCGGPLPTGATRNISVNLIAPSQAGTVTNTATVDPGADDPNPNNNSASATTTVGSGQTTCATVAPSLLLPIAGGTSGSPVTFTWSAVAGAIEYELWIAGTDGTHLAGTTGATAMSVPLAPGNASWYVVARLGVNCAPLTSAQRTFTVLPSNGCDTHGAPQLTSPAANSTTASPVTFSWTPVPQAIGYRLWIEVNNTAAQDLGTTDGATTLTADVPPGAIAAFVSALFNGCPDTHSPKVAFNVPRPDPCANRTTVTPLLPANNSVVNTSLVTFTWTDAHADGYRLWLSVAGAPAEAAGTTTETSMQTTIENGSVEWWVENLYDGCGSLDSQHSHFTIPPRQNCATTAPQRIAPANGAVSNGNVTFQWTSVATAVSYELWLSVGNATPTLIGTTSGTSLTRVVPAGTLEWFVRAIVDRCPSVDSQAGHIVFNPPAACRDQQPPHAIAPLPNAHLTSPVDFEWSARTGATSYELYVVRGEGAPQLVATTPNTFAHGIALSTGKLRWFVRANAGECSPLQSAERSLEIVPQPQACVDLVPPHISMLGLISSFEPFTVQWDSIPGATAYQLQTSLHSTFDAATLVTTTETQHTIAALGNSNPTPFPIYARVRAIDTHCQPDPSITPYGPTALIYILPATGADAATSVNGGTVTLNPVFLGPELSGQSFVVTVKEPWLSVQPASGVVAPNGTPLTVTADTTNLPLGSSLGSVQVELTSSARGGVASEATTFKPPTMTVSKVTPVTAAPKSTPPPDALIIPAVAHAGGINSLFQSDVRVTNSSAQLLQYQATFTPTGSQGLAAGRQTTFSIDPGRTIALDDVLRGWFGTGGENVTGTLEIRPMTQTETSTPNVPFSGLANLVTFAASRTFNVTANGTFGQYIPAIPFANFVGGASALAPANILSLQQIAQSDRYRTNLGIVEGSGDPVSLLVKVFGSDGQKLKEFPVQLAGGEHTQLNSFLSTNGVGPLADGRVEISVVGGTGKVTAYASVLDNQTSDPLLVTPVTLTDTGNTKWVVPGVADLNSGNANWQTDMRLFNAGTADVDAVLTFYSQGGGTPNTANVTIPAGQVRQFDKALASVFGKSNDGGAIHVSTANPSRLVATARTYNQTSTGTYGQFISGVTPNEAAGVGSRPLQILQVEESTRFRSNIGLAEVTGNPVKLEIAIVPPDAKFTIVTELQLQPNEFRQIGSLLKSVGLADTYNARVSVRAIEGNGRVTAYASVIDMLTNDPTYVPAQ
jgi:fibronectin-binding autotransporter adhesin